MVKRLICLIFILVVLGASSGAWADLVARYRLDEEEGTTVTDSTGHGYDGVLEGDPTWTEGVNGGALDLDGDGDYVDLGSPPDWPSGTADRSICAWALTRTVASGYAWIFSYGTNSTSHAMFIGRNGTTLIGAAYADATTVSNWWVTDEWHHIALAYDGSFSHLYTDGVEIASQAESWNLTLNYAIIGNQVGYGLSEYWDGMIDDVRLYDHVISAQEIADIMVSDFGKATKPSPTNRATDILREVGLSWTGGPGAESHDVYFGTDFDSVNDASRDNPMGVLISQGQTGTMFDPPGLLDFNQTYYWRIDAIGTSINKGNVWQFTTEPFAYSPETVIATSNAVSIAGQGPENTVNGSGLDADDQHSVTAEDMWFGTPAGDEPVYIQYDLGRVYQLYQMLVWNYNIQFEFVLGYGLKDVTVEYSTDAENWSVLGDVELTKATSSADYTANTTVDLGGVAGRYVRLTVNSSWGGGENYGLSEVRFLYIPSHARMPEPQDGATDVAITSSLSWRAGRGAVTHEVYMSADPNTLPLVGVTENNSYAPDLELSATYAWRVDEVNEAESVTTWASDLWSFSTEEYIVVEDFEAYTDDLEAGETIWQTWIDAIDDTSNGGSQVGYTQSPFAELTTTHGGKQAMPLFYDNSGVSFSETDRTFSPAQDWTAHGVKSLSLMIYGQAGNTGQPYVTINGVKVINAFMATALDKPQWTAWTIDLTALQGASLNNVQTLSLGIEGAGASGLIFVDDIRLYAHPAETIEPVVPSDSDPSLAAYYPLNGNINDSKGSYTGVSASTPEFTEGYSGQAMLFNGVNDSVIYSLAAEQVWPGYTVNLWVRTDSFAQTVYSSLFNNNSSSSDFQIDVDGGNPGRYRYRGSATRYFGPVVSEWMNLGVTCDGASTVLYFNGQAVDSAGVADTRFGQIALGINRAGDAWFQGVIDEVRLYDRALTAGEMAGLAGITTPVLKPF